MRAGNAHAREQVGRWKNFRGEMVHHLSNFMSLRGNFNHRDSERNYKVNKQLEAYRTPNQQADDGAIKEEGGQTESDKAEAGSMLEGLVRQARTDGVDRAPGEPTVSCIGPRPNLVNCLQVFCTRKSHAQSPASLKLPHLPSRRPVSCLHQPATAAQRCQRAARQAHWGRRPGASS